MTVGARGVPSENPAVMELWHDHSDESEEHYRIVGRAAPDVQSADPVGNSGDFVRFFCERRLGCTSAERRHMFVWCGGEVDVLGSVFA